MEAHLVELTRRVATLEATVQLLAILVGVLAAVLVSIGVVVAMWFRSRHAEVMEGIDGVAQAQEELRDEVRSAELARAHTGRHEGVVVH